MADQYWAVPISGLEEGYLAYGAPIAQLPDTSGMVEIKVDATPVMICFPADPESGGGEQCEAGWDASSQVLSPPGELPEKYVTGGSFVGVIRTDIRYSWMDSPTGNQSTVPLGAQLYIAFDTPAATVGLRTARVKVVGYWRAVLTVDSGGSSPFSFRIFMAAPARPEFWTAFVNAAEIV